MSLASYQTALLRDIRMAEEEGFEPPLGRPTAGFQDRSLQPDLGIPPYCLQIKCLLSYLLVDPAGLEPATNRL